MIIRLGIKGLWWLRDETLDDTVRRLDQTFHRLAELATQWGNWWRSYKSILDRERGPIFLIGQPDLIRQELLNGRIRQPDGHFIEELGYHITASAGSVKGKGTETSHLWVRACSRTPYLSGFNSLIVELPEESAGPQLYDVELLSRALAALGDVWDPDWLAAWDLLTPLVPPPWEGGPVLGWVTYLPARSGVVQEELPPQWRWFEGRGNRQIFIHEGGPPDPNNPAHVPAFEQMAARIRWGTPPYGQKLGRRSESGNAGGHSEPAL
jgi:hypothetical protein